MYEYSDEDNALSGDDEYYESQLDEGYTGSYQPYPQTLEEPYYNSSQQQTSWSSPEQQAVWSCAACTFINEPDTTKCSICGTAKPKVSLVANLCFHGLTSVQ